jgi:hypothetical protein
MSDFPYGFVPVFVQKAAKDLSKNLFLIGYLSHSQDALKNG